mmetsp:Transcript_5449/g.7654  ORF Transcript_5449/g.7654 Transcript_5449/m.7654 type:complete len:209 (-) Transcript_5449:46-672(-)
MEHPEEEALAPGTIKPSKEVVLDGILIRLQPVDPENDYVELYKCSHGEYDYIWKYMLRGPYASEQHFFEYLKSIKQDPAFVPFTVVNKPTNEKIGIIMFIHVEPSHKTAEISLWYTPKYHRTHANTESNCLLLRYAFEDLKYRRIEWKCDNRNQKSLASATRLGFKFEALFRQHMIVRGESRDTAYLSILDKEWSQVKQNLEKKLPSN